MLYNKNMEVEVLLKLTTLDATCLESITSILELTLDEAELLLEVIIKHLISAKVKGSVDWELSSCLKLRDVLSHSINTQMHRSQGGWGGQWPPIMDLCIKKIDISLF